MLGDLICAVAFISLVLFVLILVIKAIASMITAITSGKMNDRMFAVGEDDEGNKLLFTDDCKVFIFDGRRGDLSGGWRRNTSGGYFSRVFNYLVTDEDGERWFYVESPDGKFFLQNSKDENLLVGKDGREWARGARGRFFEINPKPLSLWARWRRWKYRPLSWDEINRAEGIEFGVYIVAGLILLPLAFYLGEEGKMEAFAFPMPICALAIAILRERYVKSNEEAEGKHFLTRWQRDRGVFRRTIVLICIGLLVLTIYPEVREWRRHAAYHRYFEGKIEPSRQQEIPRQISPEEFDKLLQRTR